MCQGATQNYAGILACRFFLGLAEAGFYPGVLYVTGKGTRRRDTSADRVSRYHLSFWYPTDKLPLRIVR